MTQYDAFTISGKNDVMFANNVTATNGMETNITPFTFTRYAITATIRYIRQLNTAPLGRCFAQHQCCA